MKKLRAASKILGERMLTQRIRKRKITLDKTF